MHTRNGSSKVFSAVKSEGYRLLGPAATAGQIPFFFGVFLLLWVTFIILVVQLNCRRAII